MELLRYVDASGKVVITEWLSKLKDVPRKSKILARLTRLIDGNFGDCKPIQDGVWELRIDTGPGIAFTTPRSTRCASCCCVAETNGNNRQTSNAQLTIGMTTRREKEFDETQNKCVA